LLSGLGNKECGSCVKHFAYLIQEFDLLPNNKNIVCILNFHPTKPKLNLSVLLLTGLINFWGCTKCAEAETSKQKFSAGNFVSFVVKRKKPVWLRQINTPSYGPL